MVDWDDDDDWEDDDEADDDGPRLSAAEQPDPSDTADGDDDLIACPFCGRPVYAEADVCPACHSFLGGSDDPTTLHASRRPLWIIVGVVLCLVAVLGWVRFW